MSELVSRIAGSSRAECLYNRRSLELLQRSNVIPSWSFFSIHWQRSTGTQTWRYYWVAVET